MTSAQFIAAFKNTRFNFSNEKKVQQQIEDQLKKLRVKYLREHHLDQDNIPDFMFDSTGLCVEVKIKGTAKQIYKQLLRYSEFDTVKEILLITNKPMGLPGLINNKPAIKLPMGNAWL